MMEKEPDIDDIAQQVITLKEWADYNGVSYMTAYRAARTGQIPGAVKVRRQWRIPLNGLAAVRLKAIIDGISEEWLGMPKSLTINNVLYIRADTVTQVS